MGTRTAIANINHDLPALLISDLAAAIDHHLDYRKKQGHSEQFYVKLLWVLRWLRLKYPAGDGEILPADFEAFRAWLGKVRSSRQNRPLGRDSQRQVLKRLRSALRWGYQEGRLPHDYSSWVPAINHGTEEPVLTFDDSEFEELVEEEGAAAQEAADPGISIIEARTWLEIFLNAKRFRDLSPVTIADYHYRIEAYLGFIAQHENLLPFKAGAIELYLNWRKGRVSPHSRYGDFRTISVFINWLCRRGYLPADANPLDQVEKLPRPTKRMRHVTYSQFRALYASISGDTWTDRRDRAILYILFFSGLRAKEVLGLRPEDIERGDGVLFVRQGKGKRDRVVPFHPDLPWLIDAYLAARPAYTGDQLLISGDNCGGIRGPMHYKGLRQMLRRRCTAAGLPLFTLHSLRHGFAMAFLNHGMEISALARSMGHASVTTTEGYARWETGGLRTAYLAVLAKFAPPDQQTG